MSGMAARLVIDERGYALQLATPEGRTELGALPGGADTLLPPSRPVDEQALERAIAVAEDWLMPHARRLRGEVLEVQDATGRVGTGLSQLLSVAAIEWSIEEVESLFLRIVDMATGRRPPDALRAQRQFVADMLMLRELAHHGQLSKVRLHGVLTPK